MLKQGPLAQRLVVMRYCFECGSKKDLMEHHVVPRVLGGTKTVLLCSVCHGKAHNVPDHTFQNHSFLIKKGLMKAKSKGVQLGRKKKKWDIRSLFTCSTRFL